MLITEKILNFDNFIDYKDNIKTFKIGKNIEMISSHQKIRRNLMFFGLDDLFSINYNLIKKTNDFDFARFKNLGLINNYFYNFCIKKGYNLKEYYNATIYFGNIIGFKMGVRFSFEGNDIYKTKNEAKEFIMETFIKYEREIKKEVTKILSN